MKLPKPKYDITKLDRLHFLIQLVLSFILGTVVYYLVYGIVQLFENQRFMNSDAKEYIAPLGIQILIVILNIVFVHIGPLVFHAIFLRQKANDQYEDSDCGLMWLSKGLRFMLPECLLLWLVYALGWLANIYQVLFLFMPGQNFMQICSMVLGDILYRIPVGAAYVFVLLTTLIYMLIHTTALLMIYRYFWQKWEREKDVGKLTMSADAYMSHPEHDNK